LARAYAALDEFEKAEEAIKIADVLEVDGFDSNYSHLRVSIRKNDSEAISFYTKRLLQSGYSDNLIKADPNLFLLKGDQFLQLFNK